MTDHDSILEHDARAQMEAEAIAAAERLSLYVDPRPWFLVGERVSSRKENRNGLIVSIIRVSSRDPMDRCDDEALVEWDDGAEEWAFEGALRRERGEQ